GDRPRPGRALDLLQHFRRDHALRRGRARHPHGSRADVDRVADRRAARRHERGRGTADPARRCACEPLRRADDARRGAARGGARVMSDVWGARAEAYRTSATHMQGDDLEAVVAMCEPEDGVKALDVATGGGHVARRLREEGCEVVTVDSSPGMQPDVISRAEELPFADGSFDVVVCRITAHHFADLDGAVVVLASVTIIQVGIRDSY